MPSHRPSPSAIKSTHLDHLRTLVLPIAREHGVSNVRVFGSFARGEERRDSDVDLLVDLPEQMSLLGLVAFKLDLEGALGRKVDVVESTSIKPALRRYILTDARQL